MGGRVIEVDLEGSYEMFHRGEPLTETVWES